MIFAATQGETFDNFWLYWLFAFAGIELVALWLAYKYNQKGLDDGTLTALIRRITKQNRLVKAIFVIFWAYLGLHFLDISIGNFSF